MNPVHKLDVDLAQLRSSLAMARADVRAAYAEREEMWERKAAALRERDEARRELERLRAERDQLRLAWRSARERAKTYGESINRLCDERTKCLAWYRQAEAERDALKAAVQHLAAEAHRRKWAHEHSAPAAFDVLHRIGNELNAALNTPTPTTRTES